MNRYSEGGQGKLWKGSRGSRKS